MSMCRWRSALNGFIAPWLGGAGGGVGARRRPRGRGRSPTQGDSATLHCHSKAAMDGYALEIHILIWRSLLSFYVKMTVSPLATGLRGELEAEVDSAQVRKTPSHPTARPSVCYGLKTTPTRVRNMPSWLRIWANFSHLSLYSYSNTWANLYLLGQPDAFLAPGAPA